MFARTSGSRLGISQGPLWFPTNFGYLPATRLLALWHVFVLLGVLYFLARRRYFLVSWFAVTALVYPEPRFLLFIGAFPASAFLLEGFLPMLVGSAEGDIDTGADADVRAAADADSDVDSEIGAQRLGLVRPRATRPSRCMRGALGTRVLWSDDGGVVRRELRADPRAPARSPPFESAARLRQ